MRYFFFEFTKQVEVSEAPFNRPGSFDVYIMKNYVKRLSEGIDFSDEKNLSFGFVNDLEDNFKLTQSNEIMVNEYNGEIHSFGKNMYVFPYVKNEDYIE